VGEYFYYLYFGFPENYLHMKKEKIVLKIL
jgi:hypothetical protein